MLTLKTGKQTVGRFAFSADGVWLAVAGTGRKVHLWNLTAAKRKPAVVGTFKTPAVHLSFRPDGTLFALASMGQYLAHDPASGALTEGALARYWWVGDIAAEPDRGAFYGVAWEARKWAFDGRALRQVWSHKTPGMLSGRGGAVLTPGGELVAALMEDGIRTRMHVRDAATGELKHDRPLSRSLVADLTPLPDGRLACVRTQEY